MGIFSNMDNKKGYCVFCGKELSDGKCTACGREAKEVVSLSSLNWQKVPMEVADALGEQKKQLFGNPLYTVKEMITNGDLFIADIHFDAVYEEEFDRSDDDDRAGSSLRRSSLRTASRPAHRTGQNRNSGKYLPEYQ